MSKHKNNGHDDTATLARMPALGQEWLEAFVPKSLWRGLAGDLIKVEEYLDDGEQVIRAEVPGLDPDRDIEVTVADDSMRIRIERTDRNETKDKDKFRSEFRYGSMTRQVALPVGADADRVAASYRDGILEVRVPIDKERADTRKITIDR